MLYILMVNTSAIYFPLFLCRSTLVSCPVSFVANQPSELRALISSYFFIFYWRTDFTD